MGNFKLNQMELSNLSNLEMSSIIGGGLAKDLGTLFGNLFDIHYYKGGEFSNWG